MVLYIAEKHAVEKYLFKKKRVKTRCLTQGGPLCILGLWGIIIFCCGGSLHIDITEKRGEGQVVTLTPADNGKTVDVHKGNKIVVQIDENLTTGYSWALDKDVGDSVSLQNSDFTPAGKAGIGAGGQRIFTFVACKEGAAVIKNLTNRFGIFHRNLTVSSSIKLEAAAGGSADT